MVGRPDHPLARDGRIDPRQLTAHRLLAREPGSAVDVVARQVLGSWFDLIPRLELGALDAVRSAAVAGVGFAITPSGGGCRRARQRPVGGTRLPGLPASHLRDPAG